MAFDRLSNEIRTNYTFPGSQAGEEGGKINQINVYYKGGRHFGYSSACVVLNFFLLFHSCIETINTRNQVRILSGKLYSEFKTV